MSPRVGAPTGNSRWRGLGIGLLALEGVGLLAVAAWYVELLLTGDASDDSGAVVTLVLAALAGAGLLGLAWSLNAGRTWGRTPGLLTQVFIAVVGAPLVTGERWYIGVPMLVVAAVTAASLLSGIA